MSRAIILSSLTLAAALGVAACATVAEPQQRSLAAQKDLARYLDGRTAGRAETCLPSYRARDQIVIDESTILYRDGANRVWRTEMNGPCNGLGRPGTAIVVRYYGSGNLCRGEIAQVVDTASGFNVGSCSFGDFVPYTGPARRA